MSPSEQAAKLKLAIDNAFLVATLLGAVRAAVAIAPPAGDPDQMRQFATTFARAGKDADEVHDTVRKVAARGLPDVWVGTTAVAASEVTNAVGDGINDSSRVYGEASREFDVLADDLHQAQRRYERGRVLLIDAEALLRDVRMSPLFPLAIPLEPPPQMTPARSAAREGIDHVLAALTQAEHAADRFARQLNEFGAAAKADRLTGRGLTSADKVVLGEAAVPDAVNDQTILSLVDMSRASAAMDDLSPADLARLTTLLAAAQSPQERAYLLKALAAGHSVDEVSAFDRLIHRYGDDPEWLRERLSPAASDVNYETVRFDHEAWTQGGDPTCVAASTVFARAWVDPVYSLWLTTGGHPGDPAHDDGPAFAERLRAEQYRVYNGARPGNADYAGMTNAQARTIAEAEIGPHIGDSYETVDLDSAAARRVALASIESAIDQGRPVPVGIHADEGAGHELVFIGHDGQHLQIYNPWGYTMWITEDDFVNNNMDITGPQVSREKSLTTADVVYLPR